MRDAQTWKQWSSLEKSVSMFSCCEEDTKGLYNLRVVPGNGSDGVPAGKRLFHSFHVVGRYSPVGRPHTDPNMTPILKGKRLRLNTYGRLVQIPSTR